MTDFDQKVRYKTLALRTKAHINNPMLPNTCTSGHYKFSNHLYSRLRMVLQTNGGCFALCTMCPIPNKASDPNFTKITAENYINQVKFALKSYTNQETIRIYCENFFSEKEISKTANQEILHLVKKSKCKYLIVDTHPIFINHDTLKAAWDILGDQTKLIIGLGLQSANDEIRKICIRTPLTTNELFLKAHQIIQEFGYFTKGYILLKPPFLLQAEAIKDTVESTIWLHEHGILDITICPIRIANGTVLRDLFDKKLYSQPKLATLVECLCQIQQKKINVRISMCDDDIPEIGTILPSGCKTCEEKILHALREYNNAMPVDFEKLRCPHCLEEERKYDPKQFSNLSFQERVAYWMDLT